jgi:hypothetical protein
MRCAADSALSKQQSRQSSATAARAECRIVPQPRRKSCNGLRLYGFCGGATAYAVGSSQSVALSTGGYSTAAAVGGLGMAATRTPSTRAERLLLTADSCAIMPLHHVEAAVPETLGDGLGDGPGFYGQRCVQAPQAVDIYLRYRCLLTRALHGSPERLAAVMARHRTEEAAARLLCLLTVSADAGAETQESEDVAARFASCRCPPTRPRSRRRDRAAASSESRSQVFPSLHGSNLPAVSINGHPWNRRLGTEWGAALARLSCFTGEHPLDHPAPGQVQR